MSWVPNIPGWPILLSEEAEGATLLPQPTLGFQFHPHLVRLGLGLALAAITGALRASEVQPSLAGPRPPTPSPDWPGCCASNPTIDQHPHPAP